VGQAPPQQVQDGTASCTGSARMPVPAMACSTRSGVAASPETSTFSLRCRTSKVSLDSCPTTGSRARVSSFTSSAQSISRIVYVS
jgi:hypothetical protein